MRRYFIQNGKIVINKYCVEYAYSSQDGSVKTDFKVTHYISGETELGGLLNELDTKSIDYTVTNLDTEDILRYDGMPAASEEEARRLIEPALEEVKGDKINEISAACKETIFKGIEVTLSDGNTKRFSLKTEDQINLNGILGQINLGNIKPENGVPYHADGEMCTLFSAADFTLIANTAMSFILRQTTYCNHLMSYVKSLENVSDVQAVVYGQELTGEFLESYNNIIGGEVNE